jgi:hypothetical protein
LPTYDLRTGSYKQRGGSVLPKAQIGKDVQSTAISAQDYMDAYNHAIALENYMKNRLDYHSIDSKKDGYYGGDIPSSEMIYNDLNSNFNRWTDPKRQYPRNIIRNNIMSEDVLQKDIPILDYYQQIDENKFRQRELLDGTIDMDVPMGYYDKRIPISQLKEYYSNDPDMHNGITIPMYDQHYLKDEMIKSDPNIQYDESGKAFIPQKKQVTAAPNKGLILPESTLKWVQNPQTGTWYQIQRPQDTNLTPVYDINTGSYKKQKQGGVLPQAQFGQTVSVADQNEYNKRLQYYNLSKNLQDYINTNDSHIPKNYRRWVNENDVLKGDKLNFDGWYPDIYTQGTNKAMNQSGYIDIDDYKKDPNFFYDIKPDAWYHTGNMKGDPLTRKGFGTPNLYPYWFNPVLEREPLPEIERLPLLKITDEQISKEIVPQDFKYTPKKQEPMQVANRSQTIMEPDPNRPGKYKVKEIRQVPYAAKFPGEGTWEPANAPRVIYVDAEGNETEERPEQKQGGTLLTKKVTCKNCGWTWDAADGGNDITTCHKCGGQGLVHAKQGGANKVVNAYSKYFQPGGEQETRLPKRIVNRYPGMQNVYGSKGENLNVIKDPNYAASDYGFGDIEFIHPGSGHVQYSDDYDYQSPTPDKYTAVYNPKGANKHDVFLDTMHGMRDDPEYMKLLDKFSAETKKARGTSMDHWYGVDSEKDPYLVGDGREQWDKNFIDGVLRSHLAKKGMGRHSSDVKGYKMEREESTPEMYKATDDIYKYLKGKFKKGGFQDDLGKNRKVFEDWTYGKDLGMTYLPKAQNGIIISDPKEYAYRNKMYTDSLNLYNAYKMQDKLMGPYSGTSKNKYKWNTAELKKGRKKEMVPGIPYPIADDYQNEKDQFKDGFDPWTARPQDLKLIKYYKSLGFTDKDIMYHSSPDVVSDKIRAVGTYDDGTAASPIYRKPKQKVTFGPNNVLPVEEKLELKTKPLQFIDINREDIQYIVPNADYLKQYLQTRTANAIVPPASTLKWVQHPQTGTWYQIERPKNTMLTPEYNIRTGSYKKQ